MKLFRFDASAGKHIDVFDSDFVLTRVVQTPGAAKVSCMYLGSGGLIGYHQATSPQLLLVVQGQGWVRGEPPERIRVSPGQAAFWEGGEWHEAGTDTGLVAVVIEAEGLEPAIIMPEAR